MRAAFLAPLLLAASALVTPATAQNAGDPTMWVAVRKVVDGQTIQLGTGLVRLSGIQVIADDAVVRAFLAGLIGRSTVRVDTVVGGDPPGVVVYLPDGRVVNSELVRFGYARATDEAAQFDQANEWRGIEQDARQAGRGLWSASAEASSVVNRGVSRSQAVPQFDDATPNRGFVVGRGGLTFGTSERSWMAGADVGVFVHPNIAVYGSAGRIANLTPTEAIDALELLELALEIETGLDWGFEAFAPGWYGMGGVKGVLLDEAAPVRPYVQAGAGFVRIEFRIEEMDFGDITDELVELSGGELEVEGTEFMWEIGGGLMMSSGHVLVDVGYVYSRFNEVNLSRVVAGVGFRF